MKTLSKMIAFFLFHLFMVNILAAQQQARVTENNTVWGAILSKQAKYPIYQGEHFTKAGNTPGHFNSCCMPANQPVIKTYYKK